jgi:hypothetical protein
MALDSIDGVCAKCNTKFSQVPKQSFLGFQKLACSSCSSTITYPLISSLRTIYWVILGLIVWMVLSDFPRVRFGLESWFGLALILALIRDKMIRRRLSKIVNPA